MSNSAMKTLTMGGKTYEIVDAKARADIASGGDSGKIQDIEEQLQGFASDPGAVKTYVDEGLSKKVDKEEGKGLSTNDFTDEFKTQLINTQQTDMDLRDVENALTGFSLAKTGTVKTYIDDGLDSKADTEHDHDEVYQPKGDYVVAEDGKGLSSNDFTDALKTQITYNQQDIERLAVEIGLRLVGIPEESGAVKTYVDEGLSEKVDKEEGKGLSTNDFTDALKTQITYNQQNIDRLNDEVGLRLVGIPEESGAVKTYIDDGLDSKADTEHDHDDYIKQSDLNDAVNAALDTAKDSGEFDGADGVGIKSIVKTSTSGLVDTYTVTLTNNTTATLTVTNGKDGTNGSNGKDGTSVTVSKVTESTESGRENVVEFSDGKSLTVKNGKDGKDGVGVKGDDGYTPVAGVDYPTDAQFDAKIATALSNRNQLAPIVAESVDWLKSNGDPTKVYIIPNADGQGGKVYAYAEVSGEVTYTLADAVCGTDEQQTAKWVSGAGYSTSSRLSSDGTVKAGNDQASGFIPALPGDVITVTNIALASSQVCYLMAYDADGNRTGGQTIANNGTEIATVESVNKWCSSKSTNGFTATLTEANFGSGFTQIRLNGVLNNGATVTVKGMRNQSSWYAFTDFVASDDARINALDDRVKTLEAGGASNIKTREAALKLMKEWDKPIYDQLEPFMLDHTLSVDNSRYATYTDTQDTDGSKRRAQVTALYGEYDALCTAHPDFVRDITNVAHGLEGATETTYGGLCSDGVQTVKVYEFKEVDPLRNEADNEWSETKPKMILISGIHWEWGGAYALFHALNEITTNPALRYIRRNMHFVVMPITNPYTFTSFGDTGTGHYNKNGVEIHNNFEVDFNNAIDSTHGTAALSEVETRYINNVMRKHHDAAFLVSAHSHQGNADRPNRSIWPSTATYFGCNIGYRLIDMMSFALAQKYGTDWSGDNRAGHASLSTSSGTEGKQAMLYGIHGMSLEIGDTFYAFSSDKLSEYVITHGAETYINFIRIAMAAYSIHDREKYAPKPAYEIEE